MGRRPALGVTAQERSVTVPLFDPEHGMRLWIASGSGRWWVDEVEGDRKYAHLSIDVPVCVLHQVEAGSLFRTDTGFVPWKDLLRFADGVDALAGQSEGAVELAPRLGFQLVIQRRDGGLSRAEVSFVQEDKVELDLTCRTAWDGWDLVALAELVRDAVRRVRPSAER